MRRLHSLGISIGEFAELGIAAATGTLARIWVNVKSLQLVRG